ncbi:MAG: oligosaccharide flippase family protein [Erysipelotrichaceae bacterium]|nr:oligosaccharide flippase family protein [Erysipelotrichaceae bacterium]
MKTKLYRAAFWLFITSLITKLLSFFIKIFLARTMSLETMQLYTLASSTMIFFITIVQLGIPSTLNTLLAKNHHGTTIMQNSIFISIITNSMTIVLFLSAFPLITHSLNIPSSAYSILWSIIPILPLVSISGICKGYFLGKQKIILSTSSGITEEITRFLFLFFTFPYVHQNPVSYATIALLSIAVGEIGTILHFLIISRIPYPFYQIRHRFKQNINTKQVKQILSYSFFMTTGRMVGSFTHFLEPLLFALYPLIQSDMITIFSYLHGYVLPILTLPSFFTLALSSWLLSSLSYHFAHKQHQKSKQILFFVIFLSFLLGLFGSIICFFFPQQITNLFYHSTDAAPLLKNLAFPFLLFTIQSPLSTILHAYEKSFLSLMDTIIGNLFRLFAIVFLPTFLNIHVVPFALVMGMLITSSLHLYHIYFLFTNDP